MKTIFFILLGTVSGVFGQGIKTIKPKPNKATVYLSGAELSYFEPIALGQGSNQIIVNGVSPYADEQSISAFFKGALIIDTRKNVFYPEPEKPKNYVNKYALTIEKINDSIEEVAYLLKDCGNKMIGFEKEKNLLLNNRLMRGEFAKDSIGLLKSSLDLLRSRLTNIDEQAMIIERKKNKLSKLSMALSSRRDYLMNVQNNGENTNQTEQNPVYQIVITLEAALPISGNLSLKYFVANAGWMPIYDIQASSGVNKISMVYRAQVYQNTGIDWKDVAMVLSTNNPTLGNTKPILTEWNLIFGYPNSYTNNLYKKKEMSPVAAYNNIGKTNMERNDLDFENKKDNEINTIESLFTVSGNLLRTEYEIKQRYNIQSDNKAHQVIINTAEINTDLVYLSVPKLEKDAFLMGKIANWEDLNLIPGNARIYFDETFIGTTSINPMSSKDTLYINLGRDKSIVIKREQIKEKCKETILGDFKVVTKTFEVTVRNTKNIVLDFEVEDQIPVSKDPNIKVTLIDAGKAEYNEVTGSLTWRMPIKPKDSKKIRFSFEVKYPKDKVVAGF